MEGTIRILNGVYLYAIKVRTSAKKLVSIAKSWNKGHISRDFEGYFLIKFYVRSGWNQ